MHIWIYDANSGTEVSLLTGHTEDVYSVAFSPNEFILASGSGEWLGNNNAIRIWAVHPSERQ
jgi:WD40 repeat protein